MPVLPSSLTGVLSLLRPAFTAPTFQNFEALLAGLVGQVGERTVCGMWQAARLAGRVHHSRAHDFFARARWSADDVGLLLLDVVLERFVAADAPVALAVDGSVFGRSGPKVHGAVWHHDSSAAPGGPTGSRSPRNADHAHGCDVDRERCPHGEHEVVGFGQLEERRHSDEHSRCARSSGRHADGEWVLSRQIPLQ